VFDMVKEYQSRVVQPAEETTAGEAAVWVAQVLAKGGDPTPRLKQAQTLLHSLGGLGGFLKASSEQLVAAGLLDGQQVALLTAVQRVAGLSRSAGRPVIGSYRALQCYLRKEGMEAGVAVTRALLLGDQHSLRADVVLAKAGGPLSFDQRRELVRSCLEHGASAAIVARSVDCAAPSKVDLTGEANVLACSLEMLGMRLLDYVLVGSSDIRRVRWYQSCAFAPGSLPS
jgi:DNA repair protein RadC